MGKNAMSEILDIARRYVVDGRQIIAEQRLRVGWLRAMGRDTRDAELTLELFEYSLGILEEHLRTINAA
jgi:hypothetical protein